MAIAGAADAHHVVVGGSTPSSSSSCPVLQQIREEFVKSSSTLTGTINPKELARRWLTVAEEEQWVKGYGPLNEHDKRIIALRVTQLIHDMGLRRGGRVTLAEWIHHLLLIGTGCAAVQVNTVLKAAMKTNPRILEDLQRWFLEADTDKTGRLSFSQIAQMYGQKPWHEHPFVHRRELSDEEIASGDSEAFARSIIKAMALDGDESVTYAEFMAYCLGRRKQEVTVNLYDLSNGIGESLSPWVLGVPVEGVWHTGVVAFGREYFFSRDTVYDTPGDTSFGKPYKVFSMGYTLWRQEELHTHIVEDLKPVFHRETYDVIDCNCNHFSESVLKFLNVASLPDEVLRQPEFLKSAHWVRTMKPIMNWYMRDGIVAREDSATGVEKQSEMRRRLSSDSPSLQPGAIVKIESKDAGGPAIWGMVCSPEGRPEGRTDSRAINNNTVREGAIINADFFSCGCRCSDLSPLIQVESLVCVRYFNLTLADPTAPSPGRLVTQMVPKSRITSGKLEEIGGEKLFLTALQAMSNSMPVCEGRPSPSSPILRKGDKPTHPIEGKMTQEQAMEELVAAGCEVKRVEEALDAAVGLLTYPKGQEDKLSGLNANNASNNVETVKREDTLMSSSSILVNSLCGTEVHKMRGL